MGFHLHRIPPVHPCIRRGTVLDLAIWQQVDVMISTDPDLLDMDGEFAFRIVNPTNFHDLLTEIQS